MSFRPFIVGACFLASCGGVDRAKELVTPAAYKTEVRYLDDEKPDELHRATARAQALLVSRGSMNRLMFEPSEVAELADAWMVFFPFKPVRSSVNGREANETSLPSGICVRVGKADAVAQIIPADDINALPTEQVENRPLNQAASPAQKSASSTMR